MKPFLLIILVFFNAYAWKTNFHGKIVTGAVLQDFVASSKIDVKINIDNVAFNAWQADVSSTYHCKEYAHRVTKYQQIFNAFGRLECRTPTPVCVCKKPGAEEGAAYYLSKAREAYIKARDAKNESDRAKCYKDAEEFLGYAIHFIQDALCPAHVFAFKEGIPDVHGDFEIWAEGQSTRWIEIMKKSQPKNIRNVIELKDTLIKMADWIATLPHRYRNPNDQIISKDSTIPGNWVRRTLNRQIAWEMRMEDLEKVVSEIGSLIKGALLYVIGR